MKKLLGILVLGFLLNTSAYTDDIKDFQIESMSIGDSALNYFSEAQLEDNELDWHNYSYKEYSTFYYISYYRNFLLLIFQLILLL